jgi:hypothetical protein
MRETSTAGPARPVTESVIMDAAFDDAVAVAGSGGHRLQAPSGTPPGIPSQAVGANAR